MSGRLLIRRPWVRIPAGAPLVPGVSLIGASVRRERPRRCPAWWCRALRWMSSSLSPRDAALGGAVCAEEARFCVAVPAPRLPASMRRVLSKVTSARSADSTRSAACRPNPSSALCAAKAWAVDRKRGLDSTVSTAAARSVSTASGATSSPAPTSATRAAFSGWSRPCGTQTIGHAGGKRGCDGAHSGVRDDGSSCAGVPPREGGTRGRSRSRAHRTALRREDSAQRQQHADGHGRQAPAGARAAPRLSLQRRAQAEQHPRVAGLRQQRRGGAASSAADRTGSD